MAIVRLNKPELIRRFPDLEANIKTYKQPQEIIIYNDDPEDEFSELRPIEMNLFWLIKKNMLHWSPKATKEDVDGIIKPDWSKIDGFGKAAKDQWFVPPSAPSQLLTLEKTHKHRHETLLEDIYHFWDELEDDPTKYRESIAFIKKQAYHFRYGYWFFSNGRPTYLDGWHFRQLCTWRQGDFETRNKVTGKVFNSKLPEYRDSVRRIALFYKWCLVDTTDWTGKEYNKRTCLGPLLPKTRQTGMTAFALQIIQDISQTIKGSVNSMIGNVEDTGKKTFQKKYVIGWVKQPIWLQPVHDNTTTAAAKIENRRPSKKMLVNKRIPSYAQLESFVDYAPKADRAYYDHQTLTGALLLDESGKCLSINTLCKMYSGSNKVVQDVKVGDLLMSPSKKPVKVTNISRGREQMYEILPTTSDWVAYSCNESHILSLRSIKDQDNLVNISVKKYLSLPQQKKDLLHLWRPAFANEHSGKWIPLSTFDVIKEEVGDYYGFTLEGPDRLFLLGDYQVTHNTKATDIFEGWNLIKPATGGDNPRRFTFSMHPSTVEEMESGGGEKYFDLAAASKYHAGIEKNEPPPSGQTVSGLRRLFLPSYDCYPGYIGKYGESLEQNLTAEQKAFIGSDLGSKEYMLGQIKYLEGRRTAKAKEELASFKRKHPLTWDDCWQIKGGDTGFNTKKLSARIVHLKHGSYDQEIRKGFFIWKYEGVDYRAEDYIKIFGPGIRMDIMSRANVAFVDSDDEDDQLFHISELPTKAHRNQKELVPSTNHMDRLMFAPSNPSVYTAAADPIQFFTESEFKKTKHLAKLSKGGGTVFKNRNKRFDPNERPVEEWDTFRFVCDYIYRPESSDIYCEHMLMMSVYFGAMMFPEVNIPVLWNYILNRGFGGYLKYEVDPNTNIIKEKPGIFTSGGNSAAKDEIFAEVRSYIENHIHKEWHLRILQQFIEIKGKDDMTSKDLFAAAGINLIGARPDYVDWIEGQQESVNLSDYIRTYPSWGR